VKINEKGYVVVDELQNTSVENIYALGDVTGQMELTPGMVDLPFQFADSPNTIELSCYSSRSPTLQPIIRSSPSLGIEVRI